ncbi:MAG: PilC/PilY family type IV pilus protein [Rhodoferax sp.]|nr:PilC/PilY family type IV pilus protein [Rhodoferax sp.]
MFILKNVFHRCTQRMVLTCMGLVLLFGLIVSPGVQAIEIPNTPLLTQSSAKPMVMLIAGRDHKLFYEAYNDATDIDGDGAIDTKFKPSVTYYGIFDPNLCYTYGNLSSKKVDLTLNDNGFSPDSKSTQGKCREMWSGNWLNYQTTSRIDALRKVLYGGYREVDTPTSTILRRAYIPQDAHAWAKEYTDKKNDGYLISDYTPLAQPKSGRRHFFGNLTSNAHVDCAKLDSCSSLPPLLSVVTDSNKRVWEWATKERPVLNGEAKGTDKDHGGTRADYTVRVTVCTEKFHAECMAYKTTASSAVTSFKPTGLLHDYGEKDAMLFGLITGSYDLNMSGGVLRKVISKFSEEFYPETGIFKAQADIVNTFNNLRIRGFNNGPLDKRVRVEQAYKGGWSFDAPMKEGVYPDWGNPVGEMMYEGLRYFDGKKEATKSFKAAKATVDIEMGLTSAIWDDPYDSEKSAAKAPWCAKSSFLVISDINPSYDSDQLPGSSFTTESGGKFEGDIKNLDVSAQANEISAKEPAFTGEHFIGEVRGSPTDNAPTVKKIVSLENVRGLSPEEPTKKGSYYSTSVAKFAKSGWKRTIDDNKGDTKKVQTINPIDTYAVVLPSPLPKIEVPLTNGKRISLVPFAKTMGNDGVEGEYQPTNQIVDVYVKSIFNSGSKEKDFNVNEGRYQAVFMVNFEDVEAGGDHDMDAVAEYEIVENKNDTVTVTVNAKYKPPGGWQQYMGYVISGTTKDGVYLVVKNGVLQTKKNEVAYFLNVPQGQDPGYCRKKSPPAECMQMPSVESNEPHHQKIFTASATAGATQLKDPLWLAAKWGGFKDLNGDGKPDRVEEWSTGASGVPDNYFLISNPVKLKETMGKAFEAAGGRDASSTSITANSSSVSTSTYVYRATFNNANWSGDVEAYAFTGTGIANTPSWKVSSALHETDKRTILARSGAATPFGTGPTVSFGVPAVPIPNDWKNEWGMDADVVNYFRGVRDKEFSKGGALRNRGISVLGDIVHSSPYFQKDLNLLFVGANDGMLHAFNATNGTEAFAFLPSASLSKLKKLSQPNYVHDYFVDGDMAVSSEAVGTGANRYMVASMGRGAKGLFALNVLSTKDGLSTKLLWEYTPAASTTAAADADVGYMLGKPLFAKMNNGSTAVIVANGYNSTSAKAVLYVFLLANDSGAISKVVKLDTLSDGDNGLSTPFLVDSNGDGAVDMVYAGDVKGQVWKFDVSSKDDTSWAVGLGGKALFQARNTKAAIQPITTAVTSMVNNVKSDPNYGKRFVFFGTGSFISENDKADTAVQSWYGLIDDGKEIANRDALRVGSVSKTSEFEERTVRTFGVASDTSMKDKSGWVIDMNTLAGERFVSDMVYKKLAVPVLIGSTFVPSSSDSCEAGGDGYLNFVSPFTGGVLPVGVLDVDNNKSFLNDKVGVSFIGSVNMKLGFIGNGFFAGSKMAIGGSRDSGGGPIQTLGLNLGLKPVKGRVSWREIVLD